MKFIGIEIGGTKLQIVRGQGKVIERRLQVPVEKSWGGEGIREAIAKNLIPLLDREVKAVGVGFGGPVEWRTGAICCSHQVEGWSGFPLGTWLKERTKLPVFVDNDANVAALAEAFHGAGAGFDPVFFNTMGSGVGGGLVGEGRIYHGATPGEAELGHTVLDKTGRILESSCSGWAVDRKLREAARAVPQGVLARLIGDREGGEARFMVEALARGDPQAAHILAETAEDMAFGLSHVAHLFHPEVLILGGGLALMGEPLREAVELELRRFVMEAFRPGPKIRVAALGEEAVPVGAMELAERQLWAQDAA